MTDQNASDVESLEVVEKEDAAGASSDDNPRGTTGEKAGATAAHAVGAPIRFMTAFVGSFVYTLTRILPFIGEKFWQGAIVTCVENYQKAANADVVNFCHRSAGDIKPIATNWEEGNDIEDKPGWKAVGMDKTWGPGAEGRDIERMGKASVILTDEAAHETTAPMQLRVAEALDLEKVEPLIANATLRKTYVSIDDQGPAVADGGYQASEIEVDALGELEDAVINLDPNHPDADGIRISARKYKDLYQTTTSAEEMQNQETRGFLAGKASKEDKSTMLKIVFAALGFVLLWEFGPMILHAIFGDAIGNAAGGGNLPLLIQPMLTAIGVA